MVSTKQQTRLSRAEEKLRVATADRAIKRIPYEQDPLFMYLWNRGFGTSEYQANPLVRLLDGWVAKVCEFHQARTDYWMLNEIPNRLAAHVERLRAKSTAHKA